MPPITWKRFLELAQPAAVQPVLEESASRCRRHVLARRRGRDRQAELLVVHEVERLVVAVVEAGNHDRPADAEAELVPVNLVLGQAARRVGPGVRVEYGVAQVLVGAAREGVRSRARHELDLDGALSRGISRPGRLRDADLLDEIVLRPDVGIEAVGRLDALILDVDAVDDDGNRALRQPERRRVALRVRAVGVDARQERDDLHRALGHHRQALDLISADRRRHRRRRRVDELAAGDDGDRLLGAPDFQLRRHVGGRAWRQDDLVDLEGLEPGQRDRRLVGAGIECGDREVAGLVRKGFVGDAGGHVADGDRGPRNYPARGILHGAGQRGFGIGALRERAGCRQSDQAHHDDPA